MVNTAAEAAQEYKLTLDELVNNNKMQINLLTILADDYHSYPQAIVETIEKQIYTVPRERKLPILYVIDSILKNVNRGNYKDCFQTIIIKVFVHAFINGDEKVRASLYKLRVTWSSIFQASALYRLDMKVHEEDNNWPVVSPKTTTTTTTTTATAASSASSTGSGGTSSRQAAPARKPPTVTAPSPASSTSGGGGQVHVNPKFLERQQQQKAPPTQSRPTGDPRDPRQRAAAAAPPAAATAVKSSTSSTSTASVEQKPKVPKREPAKIDVLEGILGKVEVKEEPVEEPMPPHMTGGAGRGGGGGKRTSADGPKRKNADRTIPDKKKSRRDGGGPHPAARDEDLRAQQNADPRGGGGGGGGGRGHKRFHPPPLLEQQQHHHHLVPPQQQQQLQPLMSLPVSTPHATALPGSHAFAVPANASPSFSEFTQMPQATFMPGTGVFAQQQQPMAPPTPLFPPVESNAVISHENPVRLDIPANNRIFVDGKAHEVFYIEDTAVIERNGLPHRIYFAGPPRNVIVDGIAHLLHFGERKTVYIDGQAHMLRFGSPSRELYMGNYAFKGQFGGPPIIAIIDNLRHEIRLSGPPPEVKIEPDPAYDLARFMHQIREGRAPIVEQAKPAAESPMDLIQRLAKSGLLGTKSKQQTVKEEKPRFTPMPMRQTSPPIPSEHKYDSVERKLAPSTHLRDFNMRVLKIRYTAVVDSLHQKQRNACPQCGMRMELSGEKYERHMDWHVKRNLQTLERSSTSRPWFSAGKDWLTSEDESLAGPSQAKDEEEDTGPAPAVNSADAPNKECMVCGEPFEEYFDEDEDVWRLRNTVMLQDKACHVGCVQDASLLDSSSGFLPAAINAAAASDNSDQYIKSDVVEEKPLNLLQSH